MFKTITQRVLAFTLYEMMQSSHDFKDVRATLIDRTDWSIELFRSCLTIHLADGGYVLMLSAMSLLFMAESIQIHYGRLSPVELKERAEQMGYATLALLFALLDVGFFVVRIAGLVAFSGSPAIATSLVLVSMAPLVILPLLSYYFARVFAWRKRASGGDEEADFGNAVAGETRE